MFKTTTTLTTWWKLQSRPDDGTLTPDVTRVLILPVSAIESIEARTNGAVIRTRTGASHRIHGTTAADFWKLLAETEEGGA